MLSKDLLFATLLIEGGMWVWLPARVGTLPLLEGGLTGPTC
jgi:hypothetical protein